MKHVDQSPLDRRRIRLAIVAAVFALAGTHVGSAIGSAGTVARQRS
jgi:hypothetical protein